MCWSVVWCLWMHAVSKNIMPDTCRISYVCLKIWQHFVCVCQRVPSIFFLHIHHVSDVYRLIMIFLVNINATGSMGYRVHWGQRRVEVQCGVSTVDAIDSVKLNGLKNWCLVLRSSADDNHYNCTFVVIVVAAAGAIFGTRRQSATWFWLL